MKIKPIKPNFAMQTTPEVVSSEMMQQIMTFSLQVGGTLRLVTAFTLTNSGLRQT